MDHKAFIATLPPETKADLTRRDDAAGLAHLAGHLAVILTLAGLIAIRVPLWPVLLPFQGIALIFLFTLQHETTHKTPFASDRLNEWVGRLSGLLIFQPFEWFRYFHLAHHRYTNIPGKDPELLAGEKPENWPAYLWYVSGLPTWVGLFRTLFANAFGPGSADYLPERAHPRLRIEARWMLAVYALAALSLAVSALLLWVWLIPLLLGQPFLRLYLLAEHGRCAFVANMFENTRTTFTNRLVRFLAWNMPYHVEHHAMPSVPFHKLPDLHSLTASHLHVTERGYARFNRRYVAGFGLSEGDSAKP